ncbi:MAG TPA: hypothetical protein VN081_04565, partial [Dongiaceae bacterium]|nr:hypothetical protein [Dongiaceae bacterium]
YAILGVMIVSILTYLAVTVARIKGKVDATTAYAQVNRYDDAHFAKTAERAQTPFHPKPAEMPKYVPVDALSEDQAIEALEKYGE